MISYHSTTVMALMDCRQIRIDWIALEERQTSILYSFDLNFPIE
jgi:hypothetical protein